MTERVRPFDRATYTHLPMDGRDVFLTAPVVVHNHSEAYRAYCMLRADLDAYLAGGTSVDEDATLDAMAGLLGMMLPAEQALLDHEGPMVLPDAPAPPARSWSSRAPKFVGLPDAAGFDGRTE